VRYPWLTLAAVEAALPAIRAADVSAVATGDRRSTATGTGFLPNYRRTGGDPARMAARPATRNTTWSERRDGFVARHVAQARSHGEPWWIDGRPTRRHLGLIAWAYTPTPRRFARWLRAGAP
jgi:hypothetical protein